MLSMNKNVEKQRKQTIISKTMLELLQGQKVRLTEQKAPEVIFVHIKQKQHNKSLEMRSSVSKAEVTDCLNVRK